MPIKKLILFILALLALSGWMIRIALASDFYEPGLFILGFLAIAFLYILQAGWKTVYFKRMLMIFIAIFLIYVGNTLSEFGRYRKEYNNVMTRSSLLKIGEAINLYYDNLGVLPDCTFPCMAQRIDAVSSKSDSQRLAEAVASFKSGGIPLKDDWNCRIFYKKISEDAYYLRSSGADRRFDTADDITVFSSLMRYYQVPAVPIWPGFFGKIFSKS